MCYIGRSMIILGGTLITQENIVELVTVKANGNRIEVRNTAS